MHAQIIVLVFPPRESVRSLVSLESRYGICLLRSPFDKAFTQLPKALMDLLMFFTSSSLWPELPLFDIRSLPARSTIVKRDFEWNRYLMTLPPLLSVSIYRFSKKI